MLSILMPVYNEHETVDAAVDAVLGVELREPIEIVLVDDGSDDGTRELLSARTASDARLRLVAHPRNAGKGTAVRTALAHARGDVATIFDADLEYEARDIPRLLAPLREGRANAVFGVRAFDDTTGQQRTYRLGNRVVTRIANLLFGAALQDVMTCHKMIRTPLFRSLSLRSTGFEIEPEIAARLLQRRERIAQVPIHYRARSGSDGKKLHLAHGAPVVATLLRCRLARP
jgi:glycosyltransferase involved in cell wall biosynthesis